MSTSEADAPPRISLSSAQQSLISILTPFRFHTVSLPFPSGASAPPVTFLEPYLPLSLPPTSPFPLVLTPTRLSHDVPSKVSALNHPAVAFSLVGPPYPYTVDLARDWNAARKAQAEEYFARVGELAARALEAHEGDVEAAAEAVKGAGELPRGWLPDGLPFTDLRRQDTGEWVGDLSTMRWTFEDVADDEERERLHKENLAREVGDPELAWSFGFFLSPTFHGKGLMHLALSAMFGTFLRSFLRCERIHGAAMAHNVASIRTQEKNGLVKYNSWVREVAESRGGGTVEVAVLKWEKEPLSSSSPA
ncbi:hypothetical protein JCM6882_006299 [Rhodosporidiobolus microsporus]